MQVPSLALGTIASLFHLKGANKKFIHTEHGEWYGFTTDYRDFHKSIISFIGNQIKTSVTIRDRISLDLWLPLFIVDCSPFKKHSFPKHRTLPSKVLGSTIRAAALTASISRAFITYPVALGRDDVSGRMHPHYLHPETVGLYFVHQCLPTRIRT